MEEAITAGTVVNVTLLFSDSHYMRTADAYMRALESQRDAGLDLAVPSVASLFISRCDSAADPLPPALHGSLGLAMALTKGAICSTAPVRDHTGGGAPTTRPGSRGR